MSNFKNQNNKKNTVEVSAICRNCKKEFFASVQFYYDSILPDMKIDDFAVCECPYCGAKDYSSCPFLFFNKDSNTLYMVFSTSKFNNFERMKLVTDKFLEIYLSNSTFEEQLELKKANRKYVEKELFLETLKCENKEDFILGMRFIRFTPPPNITIDNKYCFLSEKTDYNLSKNDIAFSENGLSLLQKNIITEAYKRLNDNGFTVNLINVEEEKKPSVTCGLMSIVMTVGSLVIIPILVNVISDIINDLRHKKDSSEPILNKNDDISIKICVDGTNTVYYFSGSADNIIKVMKECRENSLKTLSIKNCHIANAIDNCIMDTTFSASVNHQTFNEIAKEYQKVFHPNSAIEIKPVDTDKEYSEEKISYKATLLMEQEEYEAAYWMMFPLLNKAQSIEFFYNFSICISHLDSDDESILNTYERVIKKYLACADLKDLEKFDGNIKQSHLNKITQKMIKDGVLTEDEEHIPKICESKNKEDIQKEHALQKALWNHIKKMQEYNIDDLKQEAALNAVEFKLQNDLVSVKDEINDLMNKISDITIKRTNKLHALKNEGKITEKELEKEFFIDKSKYLSDDLDISSVSEQYDILYMKKKAYEKSIERVKSEIKKIHNKHI